MKIISNTTTSGHKFCQCFMDSFIGKSDCLICPESFSVFLKRIVLQNLTADETMKKIQQLYEKKENRPAKEGHVSGQRSFTRKSQ